MKDTPLVSVLMTSYNREKYIAEAIESVLASTYVNFELIIVDDQSKDNTVEIAKSYADLDKRVKVFINEKNLGDYPNRNKAASYAQGKYLKYLDADDIIYPHGIEVMVSFMEVYPESGFGLASIVEDAKRPCPILLNPRESYLEHFNGYGHFDRGPGSSIIKRDAFEKLGGFSGKRWVGDNEFWFKIGRVYPMVKLPYQLYWNRLHEEQESKVEDKNAIVALRMRFETICNALSHSQCPLTSREIEVILKERKKMFRWSLIKSIIKKYVPTIVYTKQT